MRPLNTAQSNAIYWGILTTISTIGIIDSSLSDDISRSEKIGFGVMLGIIPTLFTAAFHYCLPNMIEDTFNDLLTRISKRCIEERPQYLTPSQSDQGIPTAKKTSSSELRRRRRTEKKSSSEEFSYINPTLHPIQRKLNFEGAASPIRPLSPQSFGKSKMAFTPQKVKASLMPFNAHRTPELGEGKHCNSPSVTPV